MAGYQWTKAKPSAAGWYWFRGPAHEADTLYCASGRGWPISMARRRVSGMGGRPGAFLLAEPHDETVVARCAQ